MSWWFANCYKMTRIDAVATPEDMHQGRGLARANSANTKTTGIRVM